MAAGPHEYTAEEATHLFLEHLAGLALDWATSDVHDPSPLGRCTGLVHSILVTLDGGADGQPGYHLVPTVHPEDERFHRREGTPWYPDQESIMKTVRCKLHDVKACQLHDLWALYRPRGKA